MSSDGNLAKARWAAELRRASERGLLTTQQAADRMRVPRHMVQHWKTLGLIHDFGGGKGHPSLFDPEELLTAPHRRKNLRERGTCSLDGCGAPHWAKGLCSRHYAARLKAEGRVKPSAPPTPERNAEQTLRKGRPPQPMVSSPYRLLARTCPSCGDLITTPDALIRKDSGPLPRCRHCMLVSVKEGAARWQAETLEHAVNNGNTWTGPEMELVLRGDLTVRQLALKLGRTMCGVRYIKRQLIDRADPRYVNVAGVTEQMTRTTTTKESGR